MVVFGQGGLEIGCGDVVWAALVSTPLYEEAIAQAQHHSENQHRVVVAHPAAVVVVGDIQALMLTTLNAPIIPVQTQPVCRIESRGLDTGDQRHQFVFAAFGLAQQQSGLLSQWEADLFTADWRADHTAAFFAAFVNFLHASLRGRRLMRGGNRLGGRQRVFRSDYPGRARP